MLKQHTPTTSIKYRPDIDGLRAIAVLSVVIFHAFPEVIPGGFVGVDFFFVISGYLISTIIIKNLEQGTFSLVDFYSRRIRRIFPALLFVLVSCYLMGWITLLADEFMQLGKHMIGGAIFLSNFILWSESGYFDNSSDTKPLLHLWSLGIEEQFYIIWPLLVWLVWKRRSNLLAIILLITFISFVINIISVNTHPVAAFYSPLGRFWELLIGAILAYIMLYKENFAIQLEKFSNALSVIGLLLFIFAILFLTSANLYPGWYALIPTISCTFLIFSGPNTWVNRSILSNRLLVILGLISFPLYLWHWPLLSIARITQGEITTELRLVLIFIAVGLAWLTYRFIETPVRKGGYSQFKVAILLLLMAVVGFAGLNAYKREGLEFRYKKMVALKPEQVRDFTKWEDKGMYPTGTCDPGFIFPEAHICAQTINNQMPDMVLFGDSHAFSAYWGISKSFGRAGHNVKLVGKGDGCLPLINQPKIECRQIVNHQIDWIISQKSISTVFISFRNPIDNLATELEIYNFKKMMADTFYAFEKSNKKIVYIISVPEARINPRLCAGDLPFGRRIDIASCKFPKERELEKQRVYRNAISEVLKIYPNILVFDPITVLCKNAECSIKSDETIMWMDDNHISESASDVQGKKIYSILNISK